jgi:hypothetical protein
MQVEEGRRRRKRRRREGRMHACWDGWMAKCELVRTRYRLMFFFSPRIFSPA